ncbi:hypothetical protein C0995_014405 [Termitomyces sp. Mi166|nr:hypothetical protein C0995_014405 [Termitomyces sp. Mi166\
MTATNVHAESNAPVTTTPPADTNPPTITTTTSSTDATAGTTPTSTTITTTENRSKDPRIASLHALFPDYDDLILYSVLDSVDGDQDRAIDALLGMSDPEYRGEPAAPAPAPVQSGLTQTELDEQFARRLLLEEQDAQHAAWIAQQEEAGRPQSAQRNSQQQQYQQQGQGDTMAEIQQQIGKFAETGKKTFNTFFNKVKAKIQEMDQPKTVQSSTYDSAQYEQRTSQIQGYPYAARPRTQVPAPAQQPAYYDPNDAHAASPSNTLGLGQIQGYDVTPAPKAEAATPLNVPAPGTSSTTPPANDTQPRPLTSPPIDGGKYGLLPKRPVTLLRPGESTQLQRQHSLDDSDDGLEYAESPFEESKEKK